MILKDSGYLAYSFLIFSDTAMKISILSDYFKNLFKYNYSINQQLAEYLTTHADEVPERIILLACHISNAHYIWNSRIMEKSIDTKPWDSFPISELLEREKENMECTMKILNEVDFELIKSYTNSLGNSYESQVSDILTHIVNHGTYHRGQIALLLRENGFEPIPSDFIHLIKSLK